MANCPYVFKEDDAAVRAGRRKAGEVCNNYQGSRKYNNYCDGHARILGLIPKEEIEARQEKMNAGHRNRPDKENERVRELIGSSNGDTPYVNQNVLDAMNLNDPCDLATEYAIFKSLNQNPSYERYDEKMAFARWLRTPKHLRTPQSMEDAAKILGVTDRMLCAWKTAPDVVRFINKETENRALSMFSFAMYKLGCGIDRGDAQSIKLYKEWYEEKMGNLEKKGKSLDLDPELKREAMEYGALTGKNNRYVSISSEKNMVVDNHFASDDLNQEDER